jgi:hypothetical protein
MNYINLRALYEVVRFVNKPKFCGETDYVNQNLAGAFLFNTEVRSTQRIRGIELHFRGLVFSN